MQQELQNIVEFARKKGFQKSGPVITTTLAVEQVCKIPVFDMEILVPIDHPFETTGEYVYKKYFHLVNATCVHHIGNPALLQNSYNELTTYINQHKLQPITSGYNVTISEPKQGESLDNCMVDIYIGINPSAL